MSLRLVPGPRFSPQQTTSFLLPSSAQHPVVWFNTGGIWRVTAPGRGPALRVRGATREGPPGVCGCLLVIDLLQFFSRAPDSQPDQWLSQPGAAWNLWNSPCHPPRLPPSSSPPQRLVSGTGFCACVAAAAFSDPPTHPFTPPDLSVHR